MAEHGVCGQCGRDGLVTDGEAEGSDVLWYDGVACEACWHGTDWHRSCDHEDSATVCPFCGDVLATHDHGHVGGVEVWQALTVRALRSYRWKAEALTHEGHHHVTVDYGDGWGVLITDTGELGEEALVSLSLEHRTYGPLNGDTADGSLFTYDRDEIAYMVDEIHASYCHLFGQDPAEVFAR